MKKISLAVLALCGFVTISSSALADNVYVYGGIGQTVGSNDKSTLDNAVASGGGSGFSSTLSSPTIAKFQLGYRLNPNFAIEGGYLDSNNETYSATGGNLTNTLNATAKINAWNISAVAIAPLPNNFSVFAKLGIADTKENVSVSTVGANISTDGTKTAATYGIGAQYDFNKAVFMRAEFENYTVGSSSDSSHSNIWTVSIGFKF